MVSANSLAMTLARKSNGRVDGFVVEDLRSLGALAATWESVTADRVVRYLVDRPG